MLPKIFPSHQGLYNCTLFLNLIFFTVCDPVMGDKWNGEGSMVSTHSSVWILCVLNVCYKKIYKDLLCLKQQNKCVSPKCGFGSQHQISLYLNFLVLNEIVSGKDDSCPALRLFLALSWDNRGFRDPVHRKIPPAAHPCLSGALSSSVRSCALAGSLAAILISHPGNWHSPGT